MIYEAVRAALETLRLKFTSGNDVPVDRAVITRAEYDGLVRTIFEQAKAEGLQPPDRMLTIPSSLYCQTCKAFTLHELRDPDVCCTECATIAVTME